MHLFEESQSFDLQGFHGVRLVLASRRLSESYTPAACLMYVDEQPFALSFISLQSTVS